MKEEEGKKEECEENVMSMSTGKSVSRMRKKNVSGVKRKNASGVKR